MWMDAMNGSPFNKKEPRILSDTAVQMPKNSKKLNPLLTGYIK